MIEKFKEVLQTVMKKIKNLSKKQKMILSIAIIIMCITIGILRSKKEISSADTGERLTTVLVRKAKPGTLQRFLDLYGELKAENEVELTSPVTGKIMKLNRLEGQSVSRNQSVMTIDRFEIGARYAPATVQSPVSGTITRILTTEGEDVAPGTPVAIVGNLKKLEATIQVPEIYASEIKIGQPVYFSTRAVTNRTFKGTITRRDLSLNPHTRSLTVRATVPNTDGALFSGIFAESYIFIEEATNVYVIPESALSKTKEGLDSVFVNENGIAKLRPVTIGLRYRDQVAISEGIQENEEIIVFGREYLSDGAPIRALPEEESEHTNISDDRSLETNTTEPSLK